MTDDDKPDLGPEDDWARALTEWEEAAIGPEAALALRVEYGRRDVEEGAL